MEQDKNKDSMQENTTPSESAEEPSHEHKASSHRHHSGRSHRHHHRERTNPEELLIFPGQAQEESSSRHHAHHSSKETTQEEPQEENKTKEKKAKKPMALWQKIALPISALLCVAAVVVAAYLWVIGKPFDLTDTGCLLRLIYFVGASLCAMGVTVLFNGIAMTCWKTFWRVFLISFGSLLLVLGLLTATWKLWAYHGIVGGQVEENVQQEQKLDEDEVAVNPDLGPVRDEEGDVSEDGVLNIALFGIDQEKGSVGRSDALMIVSIDKAHNKIKMTSLDRDSLVAIDGHGEEKLTHAWAYGHGKLAVKTLNQNFGMNITEYAYVNFTEFISAIDYLGGVYVDISAAELTYTNNCWIDWVAEYGDWETPKVKGTGRQLLNGAQALSYSRNRSDGTGRRAARQREVLTAMLDRVKRQSVFDWPKTLGRLLQLCHTTLSKDDIMDLGMWVLEESPTIESLSLPTAELKAWGGVIDRQRGWVRVYDLEAATVVLHNFIYETDKPLPQSSEGESTTESTEGKDSTTKSETTTAAKK